MIIRRLKHWAKWDFNGDLFITIEALEEFVATLPSPFGLKDIHPAHDEVIRYLSQLHMNVYQLDGVSEWVHFKDVLISLATQAIKNSIGGDIDHLKSSIKLSDDSTYQKTLASGARVVTAYTRGQDTGSEVFTLKEFYAAVLVQHTFRHNLMAKRAERARQEYLAKFHPSADGTGDKRGRNGSARDGDALRAASGSQKEYEPSFTPAKAPASASAAGGGSGPSTPASKPVNGSLVDNMTKTRTTWLLKAMRTPA